MTCIKKIATALFAPLARMLEWFVKELSAACGRGLEAGLMSLSQRSEDSGSVSPEHIYNDSDFVLTAGDRTDEDLGLLENIEEFYTWLGTEDLSHECFMSIDRLFNIFLNGQVVHVRSVDDEALVLRETMRNSIRTGSGDPHMLYHYMISLAKCYYTSDPKQIKTLADLAVGYARDAK